MAVSLSALHDGRPLPPRRISDIYFCYRSSRPQSHSAAGRSTSIEKYNDLIGNRTRDLPPSSIVPQPPQRRGQLLHLRVFGKLPVMQRSSAYVTDDSPVCLTENRTNIQLWSECYRSFQNIACSLVASQQRTEGSSHVRLWAWVCVCVGALQLTERCLCRGWFRATRCHSPEEPTTARASNLTYGN
jgi:hypothetical protein